MGHISVRYTRRGSDMWVVCMPPLRYSYHSTNQMQLTQQTNLQVYTCDHLTHCIALPLKHLYWYNISIVIMDMIIHYYTIILSLKH